MASLCSKCGGKCFGIERKAGAKRKCLACGHEGIGFITYLDYKKSSAIKSLEGGEIFIPFAEEKENNPKKDWTKLSSYMNIR